MAAAAAIMAILTKCFSNCESPCRPNASHQVLAQSDHTGAEEVWRLSRWPPWGHLRYWTRTILAILNLCVAPIPPIKFGLNLHYSLGGDIFWRISRWPPWRPSWMSEWNKFSCSESPCLANASPKFQLNPTYHSRADVLRFFKLAGMVAILDIGTEPI